jgi:hypothetical protein
LRDIHWTGRTSAREVEEFPLLKAVTRERLLKTMEARENLVFAAVIFKAWKLAVAL